MTERNYFGLSLYIAELRGAHAPNIAKVRLNIYIAFTSAPEI